MNFQLTYKIICFLQWKFDNYNPSNYSVLISDMWKGDDFSFIFYANNTASIGHIFMMWLLRDRNNLISFLTMENFGVSYHGR